MLLSLELTLDHSDNIVSGRGVGPIIFFSSRDIRPKRVLMMGPLYCCLCMTSGPHCYCFLT